MNGNSFVDFRAYEELEPEQFELMLSIHNEAVEEHNRAIAEASK